MKNIHILSVIFASFLVASFAGVVAMEPQRGSQYKRYNGSLNEKEALRRALQQSVRTNQNSNHSSYSHNRSQGKTAHTIQLPREFQNKNLTHLAVSRQKDSTSCGYHACFNAWALQELITREVPITGQAIQELAEQHHHRIIPGHLLEIGYSDNPDKPDYILGLAQRIGLTDNIYFLHYAPKGNTINGKIFDVAGAQDNLNHSYIEFLETIRYRDAEGVLVGHIICTYDNRHWTTFSVVKRPNQVPELYYMNSTNASLKDDVAGYAVAEHILALIS